MYLIKRYPNRKLYDTEAKQYITLEGIAGLVRAGQEVQVTDHVTGEDLTALTFSQIILEEEKRQSGFLPRATLTSLIQAGGDRLSSLQRSLGLPKGFMHQVDDEIRRRITALVNRGEIVEGDAQRLLDKLLSTGMRPESGQATTGLDEKIEQILRTRRLPTKDELEKINRQLDQITNQLDDLD